MGLNRKLFNKLLNSVEKTFKAQASSWFIEKCLEESIIPKTLRISKPSLSEDNEINKKWTEASQNTTIEYLKITLEKLKATEAEKADEMTNNFNNLINLASNDTVKDELTEKVLERGRKIKARELVKR